MRRYIENLAKALMGVSYEELEKPEQKVISSIAEVEPIAANVNELFHEQLTFGQRMADAIAKFGGSWTFIILFLAVLLTWMGVNTFYLAGPRHPFDPYPFILLNLVLSTIAALQAPIIMMSQNRQTAKDRMDIAENYKISLKTELEIIRLHQKLDELTSQLVGEARDQKNPS